MYIYYEPKTNEIKAIYSTKPNSKVWAERGYILVEVPSEMKPMIGKTVVFKGDEIADITGEWSRPAREKTNLEKKIGKFRGKKAADLTQKEKDSLIDLMLEDMLNPRGE